MAETLRVTIPAAELLLDDKYFPVLDHGFVALVDYMGSDSSVVQAARVSYGAGTKKTSKDEGLVRYLRRHKHTTPSEMVELKFHIKMPIFVARQLVRHRTASINEYSGRYSLMPMQFYTPSHQDTCAQSSDNKQGRAAKPVDVDVYNSFVEKLEDLRERAGALYHSAIQDDIAKELARIDLPLSMYTEWYWKIDLHNLFHLLTLRCDSHAQKEIREYANVIAGMVKQVAPVSFNAWLDYNFCAKTFSRAELSIIKAGLAGETIDDSLMSAYGLSAREISEFKNKFKPQQTTDFSLDLSAAKPSQYFYEQTQLAVKDLERK